MALASEQIEAALFPRDWPELICPEVQIFDANTTWTKVADHGKPWPAMTDMPGKADTHGSILFFSGFCIPENQGG